MKNRIKRKGEVSNSWKNLVINQLGVQPSKLLNKQIESLWKEGFSHKDAVSEIRGIYNG